MNDPGVVVVKHLGFEQCQQRGAALMVELSSLVDYSGFGNYGPSFHTLFELEVERFEEAWDRKRAKKPEIYAQGFIETVEQLLEPAGFWYAQLLSLLKMSEGRHERQLAALWARLSEVFVPAFPPYFTTEDVQLVNALERLSKLVRDVLNSEQLAYEIRKLNEKCFGPFSAQEMDYFLRHHPNLVEVRAGSGYFAHHFLSFNGDIHASIKRSHCPQRPREQLWTRQLRDRGRLHDDGPEFLDEYTEGRTLLLSWAVPGSAYPAESLERYTKNGGKYFALN